MIKERNLCLYRVDSSDLILDISGNWDRFAVENGVNTLKSDDIIGKVLWEFITDCSTEHLYKMMLEKVRKNRQSVTFPFRCDSPSSKRFMRMDIIPTGDGYVEFKSRIVREEFRKPVIILDGTVLRLDEVLVVCSWCKKVRLTEWMELDEAIRISPLLDKVPVPAISHGICGDCADHIVREIASL